MPSSFAAREKRQWWLSNSKVAERYVREAKTLIASQVGRTHILAALALLESALAVAPGTEAAMELKARCLLHLRRFREVVDMFRDYVPSMKMALSDDTSSGSSENSTAQLSKDRIKLLSSDGDSAVFRCFSVSDLKKKIMAGICKNDGKEGQWRYSILGQACCHLGLMEDALVLLQTGKRLAAVAYRRESVSLSDDAFTSANFPLLDDYLCENQPRTESENISQLLSQIKLLVRRKTAAMAALDAGLYSEAIRHFSKLVDGRRGAPLGFLSKCCVHRAVAFQSAGRLAEAIADCNRALALDKSCIEALSIRATLFESIKCLPDSLHDLEHLKLLYNSTLRDRTLQSQSVEYREIPGKLCSLATKIQQLKKRVAAGETGCVDYYALIGLNRGCTKSEVESAYILLSLKLKPDKSYSFIEKCEFSDEKELDSVRDRAKLSALLLYRLIQKGYDNIMAAISDEEAAEKKRKKAAAMLQVAIHGHGQSTSTSRKESVVPEAGKRKNGKNVIKSPPCSVFKGVFCRDLSAVGNLLSQASFNRSIPVKYEALSC